MADVMAMTAGELAAGLDQLATMFDPAHPNRDLLVEAAARIRDNADPDELPPNTEPCKHCGAEWPKPHTRGCILRGPVDTGALQRSLLIGG